MTSSVEILLVEDDAADAELTLLSLAKAKLANNVRHCRDGAEALEALLGREAKAAPRLVLLDLKMPKVDGLEVLRRLREDERTRTLPVVVLSSSRETPDLEAAYKLGANSYIVKPVDFDSFQRAVGEIGLYWLVLNEALRP